MSTLGIIVVAILGLVVLLALVGAAGNARRMRAGRRRLNRQLEEVNRALAQAHADDKGWERGGLETAARDAFSLAHPGVQILELALVQVVDRPGMADDEAVFRIVTDTGESRLTLARRAEGAWYAL